METNYFLHKLSKADLLTMNFEIVLPIYYEQDFSRQIKHNENVNSLDYSFWIPIKRKMSEEQYLLF